MRDLAYGSVLGYWLPQVSIAMGGTFHLTGVVPTALEQLNKKWEMQKIDYKVIEVASALEYLLEYAQNNFRLTTKAFQLLERPAIQPGVFIAYGTQESSAFGLAVEYRLSGAGIPVFIDRSIPPGEDWDQHLEERISKSKFMVCLLAPNTIQRSEYVCKEIRLAQKYGCTFISVQHSGFNADQHVENEKVDDIDSIRVFIKAKQHIPVREEVAKEYHDAVEDLLNRLGVTLQSII
jgi:hypothetical protein